MKVKNLITLLKLYNPEHDVILSSDAEGNKLSLFSSASEEKYLPENKWSGDLIHPDDYDPVAHKNCINVLVLWPTN